MLLSFYISPGFIWVKEYFGIWRPWLSDFAMHRKHLEGLLRDSLLPRPKFLIQWVWGSVWECAFLTSSRRRLLLPVKGHHPSRTATPGEWIGPLMSAVLLQSYMSSEFVFWVSMLLNLLWNSLWCNIQTFGLYKPNSVYCLRKNFLVVTFAWQNFKGQVFICFCSSSLFTTQKHTGLIFKGRAL